MKVLVIEDQPKLARFLVKALTEEGYTVDLRTTREEGSHPEHYDLLVVGQRVFEEEEQQLCARLLRFGAPILRLRKPFQLDELLRHASELMTTS